MPNAKIDQNDRGTIIAASKNDGKTVVLVTANAGTHSLMVSNGTSGTDNGNNAGNAMLDENSKPVWTALSSAGDGTLVEVYADPVTGALLIKSS